MEMFESQSIPFAARVGLDLIADPLGSFPLLDQRLLLEQKSMEVEE